LFNEHVRLRTRTGHQILMHNAEDLIYIGNSRGSAWIELTSNGKIDIYTDDSISIRTANDLNVHADRDINLSAKRNININAGENMKTTVGINMDTKVGVDHKLDIAANFDQFVGVDKKVYIGGNQDHIVKLDDRTTVGEHYSLQVTGSGTLAINGDFNNKVKGNYRQVTGGALNINTTGDNKFTSGANTNILSTGNHLETATFIHMNTAGSPASGADGISDTFITGDTEDKVTDSTGTEVTGTPVTQDSLKASVAAFALYPRRVPRREPWAEHENLNPGAHTPSKTEAIEAPPAAVVNVPTQINSEGDQPPYNSDSGPAVANVAQGKDNPQVVVPGVTGPSGGQQPGHPVEVNDLQRYFLHVLTSELGLSTVEADPTLLPVGATPGNAQAIGMAMAQIMAECNFKPRSESMNYSAQRLRAVFPSRVKTLAFAEELVAAGQAAIANTIYGQNKGLGNTQDGDGWNYRGRGLIQLTGRYNYNKYGPLVGVDLIANPEMANDPETAVKIAVAYFKTKSITWSSYAFQVLGEEFRKAVGYADTTGSNTQNRIRIGKGFYAKIVSLDLTPITSLSPVEYPGTGQATVQ